MYSNQATDSLTAGSRAVHRSEAGAAILDYVLASSILFFLAVALLSIISQMAVGYYRASHTASGNPINPEGTAIAADEFPGGFAPCGPHSRLGNPDRNGILQNPEECY